MITRELCDRNCNECPIIGHSNNRLLTRILNDLLDKFGDGVYDVVQHHCPNLTVCYNCRVDDFCHGEDCDILAANDI